MKSDVLLKLLPLELRSPRAGDVAIVTNPKVQAFWIGHILGDGYISSSKGYLQTDQASENLAKWFHKIQKSFKILPENSKVQLTTRKDKRYDKTNYSYRFTTRAFKVDQWIETFYKTSEKGKKLKTIPTNIGQLLIDPFSLAIWFLGDGWFDGRQRCFRSWNA